MGCMGVQHVRADGMGVRARRRRLVVPTAHLSFTAMAARIGAARFNIARQ